MQEHALQFSDVLKREQEAMQAIRVPGFVDVTPGSSDPEILNMQVCEKDREKERGRERKRKRKRDSSDPQHAGE